MSALSPAPTSSWIAFHGYSKGIMTLITKTGESYAATIPESRYSEFLKAPSQGAFFNLYIKPFATVTKVDVTQDVALVEAAKQRIAMEAKFSKALDDLEVAQATPTKVKVPRKAPAKTKLPHKPWNGKDSAWIDFRCIGDPTTGPELVKALKRFIALKGGDKEYDDYIPYTSLQCRPPAVGIAALDNWGTGYVDPKYLKAMPASTDYKGLAKAYRSAYRSWVKRQAAKQAKVKAASGPVAASVYGFSGGMAVASKAIEAAAKEVFADGWGTKPSNPVVQVVSVLVGVDQKRVDKALDVLASLEAGSFRINASPSGMELAVSQNRVGHKYYTYFNMTKSY